MDARAAGQPPAQSREPLQPSASVLNKPVRGQHTCTRFCEYKHAFGEPAAAQRETACTARPLRCWLTADTHLQATSGSAEQAAFMCATTTVTRCSSRARGMTALSQGLSRRPLQRLFLDNHHTMCRLSKRIFQQRSDSSLRHVYHSNRRCSGCWHPLTRLLSAGTSSAVPAKSGQLCPSDGLPLLSDPRPAGGTARPAGVHSGG